MNPRFMLVVGGVMAAVAIAVVWAAFLRGPSGTQSLGAPRASSPASQECEYPTQAQAQPLLQTIARPCLLQTLAHTTPSTPRPQGTPIPVPVETLDEAIRKAAVWLLGGYGQIRSELASVSYVETTVGQARKMFTPDRRLEPEVSDDVPAWVFVAYGDFQHFCMACAEQPTPRTTFVVVVPKDGAIPLKLASNEHYDLRQLGTPQEVSASLLRQLCDERVQPRNKARV